MNSFFESLIEQYPLPITEQLRYWTARYASRIIVVNVKGSLTYSVLDAQVGEFAAGLSSLGLRLGEYAVVQLPSDSAFITLPFVLLRLGVIPVLAMPSQRVLDTDALIELVQPVAYVIHRENHAELVRRMVYKHACSYRVLAAEETVNDDFTPLLSLRGERQVQSQPDVSATALLLLSDGTAGVPKPVPRRHTDYNYNFSASAELYGINQQSVYLAVLSVAYSSLLTCLGILGTLACDGKVVLTGSASYNEVMPLIVQGRVAHVVLVSTLTQSWVQVGEWGDSNLSLPHITQAGGARLDLTLVKQVIATLDCILQQVFGMAEGLLCFTRLDDPYATILHSQGCPLSPLGEIRTVDQDKNDAAPGETGQLLARGPYTISSYYRVPVHNAQASTARGFYYTGDNVRLGGVGNLHVKGRIKEQINHVGEKIATAEVESAPLCLTEMQDCAVVAAPDTLFGKRIYAFVIAQRVPIDYQQLRQQSTHMGLNARKIPDRIESLNH